MSAARNGVICNVDFSRVQLPFFIRCNIKFSQNGEEPSIFKNCIVDGLKILDNFEKVTVLKKAPALNWETYAVSSPDKKQILIILNDNYIFLWNNKSNRILWDFDLSEYAENTRNFDYAEFSADGNKIDLCAASAIKCLDIHKITFDSYSGQIIGYGHERNHEYNFTNEKSLSKRLKLKIVQQLPHFKNCDFSGAKFIYENYRELLKIMGALI